jgi:mRNA interferase MazF
MASSGTETLRRGQIAWVELGPARGREQAGTRPAVVIASDGYLVNVPKLAVVVPVTSRDRGWPHHVRLAGTKLGLSRDSFAMTEQPRTVSRSRIGRIGGVVAQDTMAEIDQWLQDFLFS